MQFTIEIGDIAHLERVVNKIAQLPGVLDVYRGA
jgi:(p)ppGpp synthase/HD superfamily hydrolase